MNYRYQPAAPRLKHVGLGGALAGMLLLAGGHNAAAVATPAPTASPDAGATALGLPALSTAQHYNLAPGVTQDRPAIHQHQHVGQRRLRDRYLPGLRDQRPSTASRTG